MAQLQFRNIADDYYKGQLQGTQLRQEREKESKLRMLQGLGSSIISGNPDSIATGLSIDPRQTQAFQQEGDRQRQQLLGLAKSLKGAQANPQLQQSIYQQAIPFLRAQFGDQTPPQWEPVEGMQVVDQILATVQPAPGNSELAPRVVGNALVDSTGKVLYQAQPEQEYAWSDRAAAWIPKPMNGGQQLVPQGLVRGTGPDGMPYNIDPSMSPADREAAMADIAANGAGNNYQLPPRSQSAGLQAIPVAGISPRAADDAPSGYRYNASGTLEPIPGGPADKQNNPVAADLAKGEMGLRKELQDRVKQDRSVLSMFTNVQNASQNPSAAGDLSLIFAYMKMLDPGSVVREQEFANAQNAAGVPDQIRNAYNRAISGERLNPQQRADFVNQARQLAGAAQDRITAVTREYQGIADQYGWDPTRATGMADFRDVNQGTQQSQYQVGQVIEANGKRYRVTDVSDPNDPDVEEIR